MLKQDLERQILNTRKMSADNTLVTYDLTSGVDFSHPRKTAETLARVFFENDASKWFTTTEKTVDFHPTYKALILISKSDNKKVAKTFKDFMKDLEDDEINHKFAEQIYAEAFDSNGIGNFGNMAAMMTLQTQYDVTQEIMDEILDKIKKNTEIRDVTLS